MTATIKVEINGELLDRNQCAWFQYAPCGCVSGVAMATHMPLDEEAAWIDFAEGKRAVKRLRAAGYRFVLDRRSALPDPWNDCPHDPKWGDPTWRPRS